MRDPSGPRLIRFVSGPPAFSSLVISITSLHPCVARLGRFDYRIVLSDVGGDAIRHNPLAARAALTWEKWARMPLPDAS
jgi:hypothetical protein